jgi:hypothetical protein
MGVKLSNAFRALAASLIALAGWALIVGLFVSTEKQISFWYPAGLSLIVVTTTTLSAWRLYRWNNYVDGVGPEVTE